MQCFQYPCPENPLLGETVLKLWAPHSLPVFAKGASFPVSEFCGPPTSFFRRITLHLFAYPNPRRPMNVPRRFLLPTRPATTIRYFVLSPPEFRISPLSSAQTYGPGLRDCRHHERRAEQRRVFHKIDLVRHLCHGIFDGPEIVHGRRYAQEENHDEQ